MTFIIGTPHTHNAGHLDATTGGPNSRREQADIQTCTHCQKAIKMQEWKVDPTWCRICSAPICGPCGTRMLTHGCEPFLKKVEQAFEKEHRLKQFRKVVGLE
jgi:hypothetical protein